MQAAGLIKEKSDEHDSKWYGEGRRRVKPHRAMAKPVLVATITKENSNNATLVRETKDGLGFETTQIVLPNGKNAWRTDGKRGRSRHWNGKNRVAAEDDTTDSEDDFNEGGDPQQGQAGKSSAPKNKQGGVVNILLYVGFLLVAVGLILTLVGMGDRGFKTEELKLIGPTLIICGFVFALLRILFCSCDTCTKPKPQDEKKLLSPSTDTIDGAGTTNLAFQADPEPQNLPPLRHVQRAPRVSAADAGEAPPVQALDDEVEEDMALGLQVDYADEPTPKEPSASRPPSESTVRVVSEVPASSQEEDGSQISEGEAVDESEEVILNPAKLRKT